MIRSPKHLKFIRSLPCVRCRHGETQAAHIRKGTGGGKAIKPSDKFTVPLCHSCHDTQHNRGEVSFWGDVERAVKLAEDLYAVSGNWEKACGLIVRF